jgi:hypothetical protein
MSSNYSYHLHPTIKTVSPGISLITAVKNRTETLAEALPTWINQPEIDEIVIVDWDSDQSLVPLIEKYQNGKINLAIVKDQSKWILSHAFNLAARLATKSQILKFDADVKILPGFFKNHSLNPGHFYSGNWAKGRDENEKHLNGIVFLNRSDFFNVNGYNEFIKSYGWDDSDLYERLEFSGLKRVDFILDTMSHIQHENRTTLQDKTNFLLNIPDVERASINILINRYITNHYERWSVNHKMTGFVIKAKGNNTFLCSQLGEDKNIIPITMNHESEFIAIKERMDQLGFRIDTDLDKHFTFDEIKALYYLILSKETIPENKVLFELINKYNYHFSFNVKQRNEGFQQLSAEVAAKDYKISEQNEQIRELDQIRKEIDMARWDHNQILKEKESFLQAKDALIIEKDNVIQLHVADLHMKDGLLQEKELLLVEDCKTIIKLNQELVRQNILITQIETVLNDKEKEIQVKAAVIQDREKEMELQNQKIRSSIAIINEQENIIQSNEVLLSEKNLLLRQQHRMIDDQENQLAKLQQQIEDMHQSFSWRFGHFIFSVLGKLAFWRRKSD